MLAIQAYHELVQSDLEKLKDLKIAAVFQAKVSGKFAALCVLDSNVDFLANSLKRSVTLDSKRLKEDLC